MEAALVSMCPTSRRRNCWHRRCLEPSQKTSEQPFIVSNGDVVTQLNYREFYNAHLSNGAVTVWP